jgi:hypothetical protein
MEHWILCTDGPWTNKTLNLISHQRTERIHVIYKPAAGQTKHRRKELKWPRILFVWQNVAKVKIDSIQTTQHSHHHYPVTESEQRIWIGRRFEVLDNIWDTKILDSQKIVMNWRTTNPIIPQRSKLLHQNELYWKGLEC